MMAKVSDLLRAGRTTSFEFFPPKTPEAEQQLNSALAELVELQPTFVSVTYGAAGTTRERTHELVVRLQRDGDLTPMAHLTCVSHSRDELVAILGRYSQAGIENILALAGDLPEGSASPGELLHAIDLVNLAREVGEFSVGVAAHPEGHPRSKSLGDDRQYLAEKLSLADFAITQFFFEPDLYWQLVDDLRALGVDRPVIPGIMPITNLSQIERMAQLSGAAVPDWVVARLRAADGNPQDAAKIGIELATELCQQLLAGGAPGLHFYTLNKSLATRQIAATLGLAE